MADCESLIALSKRLILKKISFAFDGERYKTTNFTQVLIDRDGARWAMARSSRQ